MDGDRFAFLLPIVMTTFAIAFAIAARRGSRPARFWALGYAALASAFFAPMILQHAPVAVQALSADALFLGGFWLTGQALLAYFDGPRLRGLTGAVVACGLVGAVYTVVGLESLRGETLVNDLGCVVLLAIPFVAVARRARRPIEWALLGVTFLVALDNLTRTVVFNLVLEPENDLGAFTGSTYAFAMQITGTAFGVVAALVALAALACRAMDDYRDAAERDPLTGLLNRRGFERATDGFPAGRPASMVVCDIDHFKSVNDAFGHAAGDRVLVGFADTVRIVMPPAGAAARFGGEEFVLFLPGPPGAAGVIAEVLRLAFAERDWSREGVAGGLTASFGIAQARDGDRSLFETIARADAHLYAAKQAGRNRVVERLPASSAARPPTLSAAA